MVVLSGSLGVVNRWVSMPHQWHFWPWVAMNSSRNRRYREPLFAWPDGDLFVIWGLPTMRR